MRRIRLNETDLNNLVSKIIYEDSTSNLNTINNQAISLWNSETDENKEKYWKALLHCLQLRDKTIDEKGNITYLKKKRGSPILRLLKGITVTVGSAVATIYFAIKAGESATPENSFGNIGDNIFATLGIAGIAKGVRMTSKEIQEIADCVREKMGKNQSSIKTPQNTPMEPMNKSTSDSTNLKESNMKKTIRLTESELVELVQRIIKEDEMMGGENMTKKTTLSQLHKNSGDKATLPASLKILAFEKGNPNCIKVAGKKVSVGSSIGRNDVIQIISDCQILFDDVSGFGQATLAIRGGRPDLSVSWE